MLLKVFAGYDRRECQGYGVFTRSLARHSKDYWLRPLSGIQADGTNAFTYERFRIPEYCNWNGWGIFLDGSDMLLRADINELFSLRDHRYAVQVVKHDYKTKFPRKYVGTEMEADNQDYPRKNWSSVVIWNCGHQAHFEAREKLRGTDGKYLHRFSWIPDDQIGSLPPEWNHLVGEQDYNPKAKLAHFTIGIPSFPHYKNSDYSEEWRSLCS